MSDSSELSRLSRLTAILTMLQSKRIITAGDIAKRFDISKRTAYRDIKALEQAGVPIQSEEGKGYLLMTGYNLPPLMFTEDEANALITAEKLIARNKDASFIKSYQDAVTKVKAVLNTINKDKAALLSQRVAFFQNWKQVRSSNNLSLIQSCITNLKTLKVTYNSIGKEELTERIVEPQALYNTQENWILIAYCRLRQAYREFRLDRIDQLSGPHETFDTRHFDLVEYFTSPRAN